MLSGTSSGLESSVYAIIAIAVAIGVALGLGGGNLQFSLYLVALTGMGMLATTGVVVSEDTFGPVSDNAAGIAEMSGEFHGEPERIMVSLDAVGNTTKAVTKGFAIGSAVIAAVALFAVVHRDDRHASSSSEKVGPELFRDIARPRSTWPIPKTFIGLLIGGSIAFLFSALAIRAVGRTAGVVVQEVRRSSPTARSWPARRSPTTARSSTSAPRPRCGSWPRRPCSPCSRRSSSASASATSRSAPSSPRSSSPVSSWPTSCRNAGGAWDNAKKYIEDGHEGGKGSEAHKAAVIGDTVGDPFKDTAGPALNPLIKVMNLVSLLILPAIINLQDNDAARFTIAGVSLVVLIGAIAFSKRKAPGMAAGSQAQVPATTGV